MGNVHMEAAQINYRGGEKKMSVEEALKTTSGEAAAIAQLQQDVTDLDSGKANKVDIATEFSNLTNYNAGDLVYYEGELYEFQVDHTAGAWETSEVIQKDLSDIVTTLRSGLMNYEAQNDANIGMQNIVNLINPETCVQGLINNNTGIIQNSDNWISTDFIPCGDVFTVQGWKDGTEVNFWVRLAFYDKNKDFINNTPDPSIEDIAYYTKTVNSPNNAKYVRMSFGFNNKKTTVSDFFATNRVMMEFGNSASAYTAAVPSVESRIEAVERGVTGLNARFVSATLFYNAERNVFPTEIPPTDSKQICLVSRLIATGALILLWYDASSQGFRIGKVLDGSNPSDGQGLHVQYFA